MSVSIGAVRLDHTEIYTTLVLLIFFDKTIVFKKPQTHDFGNQGSFTSYIDKFYLSTDMYKMYIIHNQDQIFVIPNDFSVDDIRKYYHDYDNIVKICGVFK